MVFLDTKSIMLLIIGFIISIPLAIFSFKDFNFNEVSAVYIIFGVIALIIFGIAWAISVRTSEIMEELESQKSEQQKFSERLKIHEMLIEMRAEIKELQKRIK